MGGSSVFQRLNTGGAFLSKQEVRNCLMLMIDKPLYSNILKLSEDINFKATVDLSDRLVQERYDMELIIKFLALNHVPYKQQDVSEYLDDTIKFLSAKKTTEKKDEIAKFTKIFHLLNKSLGPDTFSRFDGGKFKGKFLESMFESVTAGMYFNINDYNDNEADIKIITEKIKLMWQNEDFKNNSGSGSNAASRIPSLLDFGKKYFKK